MRGFTRWCIAVGGLAGLVVGCRGAPWQHVAPTPDACVQRGAIKQEIATLETKLRKGEFPATPPVLMPARAAEERISSGAASTNRATVEQRIEGASASDGGASRQAISNAELANTERVMDENAARDRQTVANIRPSDAARAPGDPDRVTIKEASEPVPTSKPQAQARIRLLQKRLWDLPSGSSCAKLAAGANAAS